MLTKYESNLLAEYTSECMSSHSSERREEQPFILKFFARMLSKCEKNLQAEDKWIHKFTQQQVVRRATIHS